MNTPETPNLIRFQPGTIVITRGALEVATHEQIASILAPHLSGDGGAVDQDDAAAHERARMDGERLLSIHDVRGAKLWVLREAERSVLTVLTPHEY